MYRLASGKYHQFHACDIAACERTWIVDQLSLLWRAQREKKREVKKALQVHSDQ